MIRKYDRRSEADHRSRLGRRASSARSPDVAGDGRIGSQRGGPSLFDEARGSSDETVGNFDRRGSQPVWWARLNKRESTGDRGDNSVYHQSGGPPRRPRRDPSDPSSDPADDDRHTRGSRLRDSGRCVRPDSPWPEEGGAHVKRMVMKPPSFSGKGSVRTLLAKFNNCARYNRWSDREMLHYLTNALGDPAAQVLLDMQSEGAVPYRDLRATLVQVYRSERQAKCSGLR